MITINDIKELDKFTPESGEPWDQIADPDPERFGQFMTGAHCPLVLTNDGLLTIVAVLPYADETQQGYLQLGQPVEAVHVYYNDEVALTVHSKPGLEALSLW
jgi:hypothetical protein